MSSPRLRRRPQALVFLTERGKRTIEGIDKVWKRIEKDAVSGIDDKDRKKLRKMLRQIERNLGGRENGDDHEFALDEEAAQPAE
jgi:DNA-binding MarR family transcriptional regulator